LWQQTVSWYNHRAFLSEENPIVDLREGGMRLVFNHTADEYSGLLMGEWLWPAVRGDVFDSVNYVLYSILGHSPLLFFSGILYSDVVDAEIEARDKLDAAHEYTKHIIRSNSEWLMSDSKPTNNNIKEDFLLGQGTQDFSRHNFAMGFFVSQYVQSDVGKTLEAKDFRCASLLGLSVWDTPRLCALGLAPPPPSLKQSHNSSITHPPSNPDRIPIRVAERINTRAQPHGINVAMSAGNVWPDAAEGYCEPAFPLPTPKARVCGTGGGRRH
jgi:hypothetical protein